MSNLCSKFAIVFLSLAAAALAQQSRVDEIIQQLDQVHSFSGVSISPDGKWIAWLDHAPHAKAPQLYLFDWKTPSAKPHTIELSGGTYSIASTVSWSPDSTQFAFFATDASSQHQLFVARVPAGKAKRVTNLDGYARDARWSPDGRQIAFLYAEGGGGAGPLAAEPEAVGVIGSAFHNQRIAIIDPRGASFHQVSPAALNIYEYDWSPDCRRFATIAAPGPADNNWWIAQLYVLDPASGRMNSIYKPPVERQIALPTWSPDGKQIGFLGGLMSDEGFNGGDLFVVSSDGSDLRNVTEGPKSTPTWFAWHGNGELLFTEDVKGSGAISRLRLGGQRETLWRGNQAIRGGGNRPDFALDKSGDESVVVESTWAKPPEVWAGSIGNWRQITNVNSDQHPRWGKAESIVWRSDDFEAQGWLLYPEHYDPAQRYPMIVSIHGGPSNVHTPSWPNAHFDMSIMAGLGYFVFYPNPRGSYGEGEAFTRANVKDFGGGDLRDILAGVDAVLKKVSVDPSRLGVTGWSYGGYMTMWTVTQTHRFRAAVAGAGIADWLSYYGENSIDEWMIPFFGASVYDDPAVYAKSSPITYIKNVKTPTLVVVGERDGECPAPQSFEFWHALETLGVPTQLVVYAGEGHAFHKPADQTDVLHRTAAWFNQYLQSGNATDGH